jgi:hypothetical protein
LASLFGGHCSAENPSFEVVKQKFAEAFGRAVEINGAAQCERTELVESLGVNPVVISEDSVLTLKKPTGELLEERRSLRSRPPASGSGPPQATAFAYNSQYLFRLKSWDVQGQGWVLVNAIKYDSADYNAFEQNIRSITTTPPYPAPQFLNCVGVAIPKIFDQKSFKLRSCSTSPVKSSRTRVSFEIVASDLVPNLTAPVTLSGWYDLDPDQGWAVVEREEVIIVTPGTTRTVHAVVEMAKVGETWVPIKEVSTNIVSIPDSPQIRNQTTVTLRCEIKDKHPVDRFTLSHYGLPEPEGVVWEKQRTVPLYVWLIFAAGVLALIALLLTLLRSRRVTRPPELPPSTPPRPA